MEMTLTTPSLLFPAISLLLLAYTNRFLTLTTVIRQLSSVDNANSKEFIRRQVSGLRKRLHIIRAMQVFGVLSFILCTLAMFGLFLQWLMVGQVLFGISLLLLTMSLVFSLWEVQISTNAITIEMERLYEKSDK